MIAWEELGEEPAASTPSQVRWTYRVTRVAGVMGFALTFWALRMPGLPTLALVPALMAWSVAICGWFRNFTQPRKHAGARWALPLVILATGGLIEVDAPLRFAVWASSPWLEEAAATALAFAHHPGASGTARRLPRGYLGLLPVAGCDVDYQKEGPHKPVVVFQFTPEEFPWGRTGLYYSKEPLHESDAYLGRSPRHLYGPWYAWVYRGW